MKRFCTKWNETIELKDISGRLTCITHGAECTMRCKYCAAAAVLAALFGDAGPGFPDYTVEPNEALAPEAAKLKGESKICDVCSRPTYLQDSYLLHTEVVLSSDTYLDFIIRQWVKKGLLPSSAISGGITSQLRAGAREDVRRQGDRTPWLVCKSCLSMFAMHSQDAAEAQKQAARFWAGEKVEGVKATKVEKPPAS